MKIVLKIYDFLIKYRLLVLITIILALFFSFYPSHYANIDEHDYIYNAKNILTGNLRMECKSSEVSMFRVNNYCIYKYNIGTSFFLAPAVYFGEKFVFIPTIIVFLGSIFIFDKLLKLYKLNEAFIYLYAFFPALTYFSRTVFSEVYSCFLILLIFYIFSLYEKNQFRYLLFIIGMLIGLVVLVRYSLILIAIPFIIFLLTKLRWNSFYVLLGGLPFLLLFFGLNFYLYGNILRSGYYYSKEESSFNLQGFLPLSLKYMLVLNVFYPLMFLFYRIDKSRIFIQILTLLLVIYYSVTGLNSYVFEGRILDFILGIRFFIPILGVLIFSYFKSINIYTHKYKSLFPYIFLIIFTGLLASTFYIHFTHQSFLNSLK